LRERDARFESEQNPNWDAFVYSISEEGKAKLGRDYEGYELAGIQPRER